MRKALLLLLAANERRNARNAVLAAHAHCRMPLLYARELILMTAGDFSSMIFE